MKNNKRAVILLVVALVLVIGVCIYFVLGTDKSEDAGVKNNTYGLKDADGKDISIDYSELEKDLTNDVNKNSEKVELTYCSKCGDAKCDKKELNVESVKTVVSKLKDADKVEYLPTSRECVKYTYTIGEGFTAFEADDSSILLVSIDNVGYAFTFDGEDVTKFLSDLK